MNASKGLRVDHENHDTLDNRRGNLRTATAAQNCHNRRKPRTNTSGFIGVSWHKATRKWRAHINVNRKIKHLGYFSTAELANEARVLAAKTIYGEFYYEEAA